MSYDDFTVFYGKPNTSIPNSRRRIISPSQFSEMLFYKIYENDACGKPKTLLYVNGTLFTTKEEIARAAAVTIDAIRSSLELREKRRVERKKITEFWERSKKYG